MRNIKVEDKARSTGTWVGTGEVGNTFSMEAPREGMPTSFPLFKRPLAAPSMQVIATKGLKTSPLFPEVPSPPTSATQRPSLSPRDVWTSGGHFTQCSTAVG